MAMFMRLCSFVSKSDFSSYFVVGEDWASEAALVSEAVWVPSLDAISGSEAVPQCDSHQNLPLGYEKRLLACTVSVPPWPTPHRTKLNSY